MLEDPEVPEGTDTPEAPAPDAEPAAPWDGSVTSFDAQPWAKHIPDDAKEHIRGQYERGEQWRTLLDSDDATAKLTAEMDGLRSTLGLEVKKHQAEAAKYKGEAESWQQKHTALESERTQERQAARDAALKSSIADIYESYAAHTTDEERMNGPMAMFVRLTDGQGIDDARAAKMVRAAFDLPTPGAAAPAAPAPTAPPKTRDVTPPDSVGLANRNGLNPAEAARKPPPISPEDARRRLLEKIEAEEEANGDA